MLQTQKLWATSAHAVSPACPLCPPFCSLLLLPCLAVIRILFSNFSLSFFISSFFLAYKHVQVLPALNRPSTHLPSSACTIPLSPFLQTSEAMICFTVSLSSCPLANLFLSGFCLSCFVDSHKVISGHPNPKSVPLLISSSLQNFMSLWMVSSWRLWVIFLLLEMFFSVDMLTPPDPGSAISCMTNCRRCARSGSFP